jgi:hypothetical protein
MRPRSSPSTGVDQKASGWQDHSRTGQKQPEKEQQRGPFAGKDGQAYGGTDGEKRQPDDTAPEFITT